MMDQLDDLIVPDPGAGMERQHVGTAFGNRCLDRRLHVADRCRVVGSLQIVALPIVGNRGRDLPTQPADHVRVGIVFDVVYKTAVARHVFVEPVPAVLFEDHVAGQSASAGVKSMKTEESIRVKLPAGVVRLKISAKKRGLIEFIESQQGIRNAASSLFGISDNRSMHSS